MAYPRPKKKRLKPRRKRKGDKIVIRVDKVIIKFDKRQQQWIRYIMDVYRFAYNRTVKYLRTNKVTSFFNIRTIIRSLLTDKQKEFIEECPSHFIDEAIHDVVKAYKTCFTNYKRANCKHFRLRYKKASSAIQTIAIPSEYFHKKKNSFCISIMGLISSDKDIHGSKTCRLSWYKNNNAYILYKPVDKPTVVVTGRKPECSLDPGIRTFQTLYSKTNVDEFGVDNYQWINPLLERIKKAKPGRGVSLFINRIYNRIKNKVDDLHWQTISSLVTTYDTILVGNMSTKGICQGNLYKKIKPVAYMLSHYKFNQRLQAKAEQYGCTVHIVDERYTSKTCGGCFERNHTLGASKTFSCPCGYIWDRDFNGARNIMLRHHNLM